MAKKSSAAFGLKKPHASAKKPKPFIGHFLVEWREYAGYKQDEAAPLLGCDQGTLSKREARKLPIDLDFLEQCRDLYKAPDTGALLNINPKRLPNDYRAIAAAVVAEMQRREQG